MGINQLERIPLPPLGPGKNNSNSNGRRKQRGGRRGGGIRMDKQGKPGGGRRRFLRYGLGATVLGLVSPDSADAKARPTEPNILGPYHRKGAPFRARLSAPDEPGEPLIIRGRVLNTDEAPLKGAVVDVWQANAAGRYDNDDPGRPPDPETFLLRGQIRTDAAGRYEFESVIPGRYSIAPGEFRPRHIHYIVSVPGYVPLTTQLYFRGDPDLKTDRFARPSLVIDLEKHAPDARRKTGHHTGVFDIVLARPGEGKNAKVTSGTDEPSGEASV
jgi:catechol 1,2-dioxygenase